MIKQILKVLIVGWIAKRFTQSQNRRNDGRRDA